MREEEIVQTACISIFEAVCDHFEVLLYEYEAEALATDILEQLRG